MNANRTQVNPLEQTPETPGEKGTMKMTSTTHSNVKTTVAALTLAFIATLLLPLTAQASILLFSEDFDDEAPGTPIQGLATDSWHKVGSGFDNIVKVSATTIDSGNSAGRDYAAGNTQRRALAGGNHTIDATNPLIVFDFVSHIFNNSTASHSGVIIDQFGDVEVRIRMSGDDAGGVTLVTEDDDGTSTSLNLPNVLPRTLDLRSVSTVSGTDVLWRDYGGGGDFVSFATLAGITDQIASVQLEYGGGGPGEFVDTITLKATAPVLPEPAMASLLGMGGLGLLRRRRAA